MKIPIILAIIVITIGVAIFYPTEPEIIENQNEEIIEFDEIITIGTINRDSVKMSKRYQPLADYIAEKLSDETTVYKGIVKITPTEKQMVQSINDQEMDIFFDSPLIGLKVAQQTELIPALLSWKEGYREYHTVFIVPIESDITFDNLYDKTIIFEDNRSTSGFLLPLVHLKNSGYDINYNNSDDFSFVFSLDDENTPVWILEGRGDVGATSNLDFEDIPLSIKEKLKIIESTEAVPRQMVFVGNHVEFQEELKKILLEMNNESNALEILDKISHTTKFSEIDIEKDVNHVKELLEYIQ